MDLRRPGFPEQADDLQGGRSPDDGVVHQHDPLPIHDAAHRGKFHLHAQFPQRLHGLDEGAAHILVLHEAHLIRDAAFLGIAHGGAQAGFRDAHDHVSLHGALPVQTPAGLLAVRMDIAAVDVAVRTGEIDVFHRAHPMLLDAGIPVGPDPLVVQADDFARIDVTDELRAHDLKGAGFAGDHPAVPEPAETQGLDAVLVAAGVDAVLGHQEEGEAAFHHVERLHQAEDPVLLAVLLDQMRQQFAVGIGLEQRAVLLEVICDLAGVDHVSLARQGEITGQMMEKQGLHVVQAALGGIGILHAAESLRAGKGLEFPVGEDLAQQAQPAVAVRLAALVKRADSTAFLSPVLEVVKAIVDQGCGVRDAIDCQYTHILYYSASIPNTFSSRSRTVR